jgi:hypothetical protein
MFSVCPSAATIGCGSQVSIKTQVTVNAELIAAIRNSAEFSPLDGETCGAFCGINNKLAQ